MPTTVKTGGCLCGKVRYHAANPRPQLIACHCTQCRKTSGHFVVATACATTDLQIDDPHNALAWYASSAAAQRGFCKHCGSSLFWRNNNRPSTSIMAGTLDNANDMQITRHIYVDDAGGYYSFDDGVDCYGGAG